MKKSLSELIESHKQRADHHTYLKDDHQLPGHKVYYDPLTDQLILQLSAYSYEYKWGIGVIGCVSTDWVCLGDLGEGVEPITFGPPVLNKTQLLTKEERFELALERLERVANQLEAADGHFDLNYLDGRIMK